MQRKEELQSQNYPSICNIKDVRREKVRRALQRWKTGNLTSDPRWKSPTDLLCNPIESVPLAATVAAEATSVAVIFRFKQSK